MSRSNWKGSAGFEAVNDPTGVLDRMCLQASTGMFQRCEEYLIQEIGTSNTFNKNHYNILFDFAISADEEFNGSVAIMARAGNYTTVATKPVIAQNCYIVTINKNKIEIFRRINNVLESLVSSKVRFNFFPNIKYNVSLKCYGNTSVGATYLQLHINGQLLAGLIDSSGLQITTGVPGFGVWNGSIYLNNFAVMELDSSGFPV